MANEIQHEKTLATFGMLLRTARKEKGWSQGELAQRARVALRTVLNIENVHRATRKVRFDVVIRLALALEKPPREWLTLIGHQEISDGMISQISKKAGILDFFGEDDPSNFFKMVEKRILNSGPVLVSMTYCTFSDFAHQEFLAQRMAPLIDTGKLFLAVVCAYPKISELGTQDKPTLSRIYLQVRNEVIALAKEIKTHVKKPAFRKHVAGFSLNALKEPACFFPQVGLSQFRQILIQSHPDYENKPDLTNFELSTWISFFQDQKERWIRIYPTPEIWKSREDAYRKICSAWKDYLAEIHRSCDFKQGWIKDKADLGPWNMADIS